jgi:hypothetical protein
VSVLKFTVFRATNFRQKKKNSVVINEPYKFDGNLILA